jgi:hypothetical protein
MQSFTIASVLALMASTAIATEYTGYEIRNFFERKPDGQDITFLSYDIVATNGGTLDFTCIPYDPATGGAAANFEDGHVYDCGQNSAFSFSYSEEIGDPQKGKLFLWQGTNEDLIQGSTTIPPPICHAGGNGGNDTFCDVPAGYGRIFISLSAPGS